MALTIGNVEIEIFARWNDTEYPLGTVTVPIKVNASSVIRETQAAMTATVNPEPTPGPVHP